jgi:putative ABC transport system substrate-binding protein
LAGKRLELLREVVPGAKRVGMLVAAPVGDAQKAHYRGTEDAARKLGMEIRIFAPRSIEELEELIPGNTEWWPQILSIFSGSWFSSHRTKIIDWVARMKLPAIHSSESSVELGGLMSYSDDGVQRQREVAGYVAKVLSRVKPADLPVQHPTKFYLAVNLKTAKALGLTIPQTILLRADKVIQ